MAIKLVMNVETGEVKPANKKEMYVQNLEHLGLDEKKARAIVNSVVASDGTVPMFAMTPEQLKECATDADMRVAQVKEELDNNDAYCDAKDTLKELNAGFRDATKRDRNVKRLCMLLLKKGKAE